MWMAGAWSSLPGIPLALLECTTTHIRCQAVRAQRLLAGIVMLCFLAEAAEVWVAPDAVCRWRQSAAEVVVQVPGLPGHVRSADLDVDLGPKHCKGAIMMRPLLSCACNPTRHAVACEGRVLLQGGLGGAIQLGGSVWTLERVVEGRTTCTTTLWLHLSKATSSLVARCARCSSLYVVCVVQRTLHSGEHGSTWWPRLLEHHDELPWDVGDKDYSDLPESVLREHFLLDHRRRCGLALEGT